MNITHYLELHNSEHGCDNIECMCDRNTGITIIMNALTRRPGAWYFIQFYALQGNTPEYLPGFNRDDRGCYCYDNSNPHPLTNELGTCI
jgi:hypothetical protein